MGNALAQGLLLSYGQASGPTMPTYVDVKIAAWNGKSYSAPGAFASSNAGDVFVLISQDGFNYASYGYTQQSSVVVNSVTFKAWTKVRTTGSEAHGVIGTAVVIFLMRDVDPTTPVNDIQGSYLATSNTTLNVAAATAANANSYALIVGRAASNTTVSSGSFASLSNLTERVDNVSAFASFFTAYTGEKASAGSISAGTLTLGASRATKYGIIVVLNGA